MIISESKWRKWLGLPYISVQGEWPLELNEIVESDDIRADNWTGLYAEYRWPAETHDWLHDQTTNWSLEHCRRLGDFSNGQQARIWFRDKKLVVMFKLIHGGKTRPDIKSAYSNAKMAQAPIRKPAKITK